MHGVGRKLVESEWHAETKLAMTLRGLFGLKQNDICSGMPPISPELNISKKTVFSEKTNSPNLLKAPLAPLH